MQGYPSVSQITPAQQSLWRNDNLSVAARAASHSLEIAGYRPLICALARVIVYAFGTKTWVKVSTRELRARAKKWGIVGWYGSVSHGVMTEALEALEEVGFVTWERAWIPKHNARPGNARGQLSWEQIAMIEEHTGKLLDYPHRSACGEPRAPARTLRVGVALQKLLAIASRAVPIRGTESFATTNPTSGAPGAHSIRDAKEQDPRALALRSDDERAAQMPHEDFASLIECAPGAPLVGFVVANDSVPRGRDVRDALRRAGLAWLASKRDD